MIDIFGGVAPHRVTNANIANAAVEKLFDDGRKASILYCDPPWGDSAMKLFATMAEKKGEKVSRINFQTMLNRLFDLTKRHVDGVVFIEIGTRWVDEIGDRMQSIGLRRVRSVSLVYGPDKTESQLLTGSFDGRDADLERVRGMSGAAVAYHAIAPVAVRGTILFDPMCGCGYSARAALAHGMEFRGNEFSWSRLQKTIKLLK